MIALFSCRERNNMFDMGSEDFVPPPPIFWHDSVVTGIYSAIDSILIGMRFHVEFTSEFERTLVIHNELYYTDTILFAQFDEIVGQGNKRYFHDVYGDIKEGPYYFRIFFGGTPIGYWAILVQGDRRSLVIVDTGV
jgi:hypothetical protein